MNAVEYDPTAKEDTMIELIARDADIVDVVMQRYLDNLKAERKQLLEAQDRAVKYLNELIVDTRKSFDRTAVETTCEAMGIQSIVQDVKVDFENELDGPRYVVTLGLIDTDLLTKGGHGTPQIFKYRHVPITTEELISSYKARKQSVDYSTEAVTKNNADMCDTADVEARVRSNLKRIRLAEDGQSELVNTDVLLAIHTSS